MNKTLVAGVLWLMVNPAVADDAPPIDRNGDDVVAFDEFTAAYAGLSNVGQLFVAIDLDRSGSLSIEEIDHAKKKKILPVTSAEACCVRHGISLLHASPR
ncbi:hypothetical protein [uncultured Cohaesibacter sp.]|uniref:hypothetical protein n=1 Tax=uncultured Cohaesibacter sp. TaxID=1002546 RepID=UPI0029C7656F|nr:hypothetical protein [uncultured Cohaesibacter sp.]